MIGNLLRHGAATGTNVLLFVLAAVAGRYLGPEDFGIFSFALAFVFFFDFITDPGLYHLLIREIARDREASARYVRHGMAWKLTASPVAFILIAIGVNVLHDNPRIDAAVYLMAAAQFLKSAKDVYRSALLANERFDLDAISAFLERGGILAAGVVVLTAGYGLLPFCGTFVAVRALDLLVIRQMTVSVCGRSRSSVEWGFLRSLIMAGLPIGALYVTLNIYSYVDTVMISVLRDQTETGWYGASFRIYEGLRMIPSIVGTVLLPRLSRAFENADGEFSRLATTGYRYIFFLALLVSGVGILLSGEVMRLAFGPDYEPAAIALGILVAGVPFVYIAHFLQMVLIAMDRQNLLLQVALLGLGANVALNVFIIQMYGFVGAAVTTIAVEALVCGILSIIAYRGGAVSGLLSELSIAFGCWLVAAALGFLALASFSPYVQAAALATAFVVLLFLLGVVDASEWSDVEWPWSRP